MNQQHMQFDKQRQDSTSSEGGQEIDRPRPINIDPREQREAFSHQVNTDPREQGHGYDGYGPGYVERRQRQGEKLQPGTHRAQPQIPKRRHWLRPLIIVIFIFMLFGGASSLVRWLGIGTTLHVQPTRTFTVSQNAHITVNSNVGNIVVHRGSGDQLSVTAKIREDFLGHTANVQYDHPNNSTLNIRVNNDEGFLNLSSAELEIMVPDNMNLDLHTSAGNVEVDGIHGQLTAESSAGNVEVSNANLSGEGTLHTSAGNVDFDGEFADNAHYTLSTSAGNVETDFAENDNIHIDARTSAGHVDSDVPEIQVNDDGPVTKEAHGDLGSDQNRATINLETSAGNIDIDTH